jgi:hypothetical protein
VKSSFVPFLLSGVLVSALPFLSGSCANSPGPGSAGRLVGRTDCKSFGAISSGAAATVPTSDRECVEYDYDGRSVLRLKHINAAFNCCPGTISADFLVEGGEIRIKEKETSSLCDCDCLYDLDYEFVGLARGVYTISVVGPYQPEGDPPLEFLVDLAGSSSGSFCVERTRYPWGF